MNLPVRAAVIGAGAIGAGLDEPGTAAPLTHAGGYRAAGFDLVLLIDPNEEARRAARRWGCAVAADVRAIKKGNCPELISVATPAAGRPMLLRQVLELGPLVVVAEKPLAETAGEADAVAKAYRAAGVPLLVNYSRRFTPVWQNLRGGNAMSATIRYGKGVRHNGTHAIDLCRMIFGECLDARPLARKRDHWSDDPTVSAFLSFERCPEVFLQGLDERAFTLFEVDIVAPNWRLVVDSDGRRARRFELRDGTGVPPGKRLIEIGTEDTAAASAMLNLMQNIRDILDGGRPLCCGEDAVAAQLVAERLSA
jgi:predicted dehydrogenase